MTKIAIMYHSTYGHTKLQAEAFLRGAQGVPSTPISPPSGPAQWLFQKPPAESKFLAAK
jgi:hypothetical protein